MRFQTDIQRSQDPKAASRGALADHSGRNRLHPPESFSQLFHGFSMTSSGLSEYHLEVEERNDMSLAIQKILVPAIGLPAQPGIEEAYSGLNVSVVFTSVESTLAALKEAGTLASSLGARITLLVPQVVPYPLPLETPPVLVEFNEKRFHVIASQSPVETNVHIYLCRDKIQTLISVLNPRSIVVLGGRKRWWWPTRDQALARGLRRAGHEVIFKEMEQT
jgi:hypothetical protein